ncbi:hypothetical protein AK51_10155 [Serratia nematodiphila DZ0503SBS1]|nr:hypothetical protein AK51_10155 [Serratia nematodiphila DZ0503SBS1]
MAHVHLFTRHHGNGLRVLLDRRIGFGAGGAAFGDIGADRPQALSCWAVLLPPTTVIVSSLAADLASAEKAGIASVPSAAATVIANALTGRRPCLAANDGRRLVGIVDFSDE